LTAFFSKHKISTIALLKIIRSVLNNFKKLGSVQQKDLTTFEFGEDVNNTFSIIS